VHTWCKRRFCGQGTLEDDRVPGLEKAMSSPWTVKLLLLGHSDYKTLQEHDKQHEDSSGIRFTMIDDASSVMSMSMHSPMSVGNR